MLSLILLALLTPPTSGPSELAADHQAFLQRLGPSVHRGKQPLGTLYDLWPIGWTGEDELVTLRSEAGFDMALARFVVVEAHGTAGSRVLWSLDLEDLGDEGVFELSGLQLVERALAAQGQELFDRLDSAGVFIVPGLAREVRPVRVCQASHRGPPRQSAAQAGGLVSPAGRAVYRLAIEDAGFCEGIVFYRFVVTRTACAPGKPVAEPDSDA